MSMSTGPVTSYNADINVTPLVDIMLVLLIIFMVVTPLLGSNVALVLPRGKYSIEEKRINSDKAIVVSVPSNSSWYLGRDEIKAPSDNDKLANLVQKITDKMKNGKPEDNVVYIKADQNVQYGYVVQTVDAIRQAGIDRIGLVVDIDHGEGGATPTTGAPAPAKK